MSFTPMLKEQVLQTTSITKLREAAIAEGMTPLSLDMAAKLQAGLTTIEEAISVAFYESGEISNICTRCARVLGEGFLACPYCGNPVTEFCQTCKKPLSPEWVICPYCCQPSSKNDAPQKSEFGMKFSIAQRKEAAKGKKGPMTPQV
jgi:RNA polymerase subunit RPABC4/transcription elongation factor Spt4